MAHIKILRSLENGSTSTVQVKCTLTQNFTMGIYGLSTVLQPKNFTTQITDKLIWGNIIWVETIEQATEQEMQALVDEFKAFAEPEDKNGNYKICTAFYKKYIQTK